TEAHAGKRRLARAAATTATARHGRIDRLIVRDDLDFLLMTLGRALAFDTGELEEEVEAGHGRLLGGGGRETLMRERADTRSVLSSPSPSTARRSPSRVRARAQNPFSATRRSLRPSRRRAAFRRSGILFPSRVS